MKNIQTIESLLLFLEKECKEPLLAYQIRSFTEIVHYQPFKLSLNVSCEKESIVLFLQKKLEYYTKTTWEIEVKNRLTSEKIKMTQQEIQDNLKKEIIQNEFVQSIMGLFPDTVIKFKLISLIEKKPFS